MVKDFVHLRFFFLSLMKITNHEKEKWFLKNLENLVSWNCTTKCWKKIWSKLNFNSQQPFEDKFTLHESGSAFEGNPPSLA